MTKLRFGPVSIDTSNEGKVFFPREGITKGDLIDYYMRVAPRLLPHVKGRPLSFQRFPDGIEKSGFFQKDAPAHYPEWISTTPIKKKGGTNHHVVADNKATLAFLANNGVVTIHAGLSREPDVNKPDRIVFDLDPSVDDFSLVRAGARAVREILEELDLPTFVQVTGSRGIHVVVPIRQELTFERVAPFAHDVAMRVVRSDPDMYTIEHRKNKRGDRLLIDHFRNRYSQTVVVPYSVRARTGASVAMPVSWEELGSLRSAASFSLGKALKRIEKGTDPWRGMARRARSLRSAQQRLART